MERSLLKVVVSGKELPLWDRTIFIVLL